MYQSTLNFTIFFRFIFLKILYESKFWLAEQTTPNYTEVTNGITSVDLSDVCLDLLVPNCVN